jgi:hypothetical protein
MALHADILALGSPIESDIEIVQGDGRSYLRTLRKRNTDGSYTPYDITGWTFRLQVRADYATATVLIAATVAPTANAALGEYSEAWDPTATAALTTTVSDDQPLAPLGVYDLDVSIGGQTVTLKRGRVTLKRQVSRT